MQIRLLLGPAGSGKTYRCLEEARQALSASAEGPPLLLVAPKQTTYQLERQILASPAIIGYTRLHILSLERLAHFVVDALQMPAPEILAEEGRLMVLRGLLARKRDDLKLFRASARLTGFAQQLSLALREMQRQQLTPAALNDLAREVPDTEGLAYKLQDLATLFEEYVGWLEAHQLQDADCLLATATAALTQGPKTKVQNPQPRQNPSSRVPARSPAGSGNPATAHAPPSAAFACERLWVDGFAEFSGQELELLAALMPYCGQATITFCLDQLPQRKNSWLSNWSVVGQTFEQCRQRLMALPEAEVVPVILPRDPARTRFVDNPVLRHLEAHWATPEAVPATRPSPPVPGAASRPAPGLRIAVCADPEAEATLAARETLEFARAGGRYRDVTILVRNLEGYYQTLQRVFARYDIPFFLDRRESVSHHPLAELTRSALRTVAFQWSQDDWFAALKTGLVPAGEAEIDRLENEALARGWRGAVWQSPILVKGDPGLTEWLAGLHQRLLPPFQRLALALGLCGNKPNGLQLAAALRDLWLGLGVEGRLQDWAAAEIASSEFRLPNSVHATVWEQMNAWLTNVELAFPQSPLPLREWLPILEAGLANLTVGVIPPALDQVLIGAIDRSRNPDIQLALVLGLNETVFPAPPQAAVLLTETDRLELEKRNVLLGSSARRHLGRERFYAYLACTRARHRVVLTCAQHDAQGAPLNPSPFLAHLRRLFPALKWEVVPKTLDWRQSQHPAELIAPLLRVQSSKPEVQSPEPVHGAPSEGQRLASSTASPPSGTGLTSALRTPHSALLSLPSLAAVFEQLRHFQNPELGEKLAPELADRLYGPVLRSSVSRLEQFAACPFKFFVHSGLRAEERQKFELDIKEQGTFQHDVLAFFHQELQAEGKRWRDITPAEARARVARIAKGLMASYRDGLLEASEETRFMARSLSESLQEFIQTLVAWMHQQYRFDPVEVELPFGEDEQAPAWVTELDGVRRLELYGRIDRVDLLRQPGHSDALCVVVDYKSSPKQLDPLLLAHGLQLQLLTYLNVLRHWPNPRRLFGVDRLIPAGVFYVNLRGKYDRAQNRLEALADPGQARKLAYRHTGRFDSQALPYLDGRPGATQGDQFNYRLTKAGQSYKAGREALGTAEFHALLEAIAANLSAMGRQIYAGVAEVAPYRKGAATACDQCSYQPICRIDPWTHHYRVLRQPENLDEQ